MAEVILKGLSKSFAQNGAAGSTLALQNLSLHIRDGEFFFLLGPSGCGKTTLLRLIAGLLEPDSGSITIDGQEMRDVPAHKRGLAMVFQNYALWPHMTVAQNVAFGLEMAKVAEHARSVRVREALEMTHIAELAERFPHGLSGGQQQRVALARALVMKPRVLLLDEPLSNLDAKLRVEMRRELRALHERTKMTMIYVTHDQGEALALGTKIAVLNAGSVEQVGTGEALLTAPATDFVREFLGDIYLVRGTQLTSPTGATIAMSNGLAVRQEGLLTLRPPTGTG
jgi:putative spermidine/putrescine transport system ATP-binding protein